MTRAEKWMLQFHEKKIMSLYELLAETRPKLFWRENWKLTKNL